MLRNPFFFCFVFNNLLKPFINKPDSSRDLIIFMISFISSLQIIRAIVSEPNIFLLIAASVADAAAVSRNGFKKLLANGLDFH